MECVTHLYWAIASGRLRGWTVQPLFQLSCISRSRLTQSQKHHVRAGYEGSESTVIFPSVLCLSPSLLPSLSQSSPPFHLPSSSPRSATIQSLSHPPHPPFHQAFEPLCSPRRLPSSPYLRLPRSPFDHRPSLSPILHTSSTHPFLSASFAPPLTVLPSFLRLFFLSCPCRFPLSPYPPQSRSHAPY